MQFPSKGGSAYFAVSQRQPLFLFLVHVRNEPFTQNTDVYNVNDCYEDCHFAVIHLKTTTEKNTVADLWIIQWRLTRNGHFHLMLLLYESISNKLEMSYGGEMTIICEHHPPEVTGDL